MTDTNNFRMPNFFGENFFFPQINFAANSINTGDYFFTNFNSYTPSLYFQNFTPFFNIFDFPVNNINFPTLDIGTSVFNFPPIGGFGNLPYQLPQIQPVVPAVPIVRQEPIAQVKPAERIQDSYEPEDTDADNITPPTAPVTPPVVTQPPNTRQAVAGLDSRTYIAEEIAPGCYIQKGRYIDTKNLKPYMKERLAKLAKKAEELGYSLVVSDGYRSHAAQVDLKRRKPGLAATPGRSAHEYGVAVDVALFKNGKFVKDIYKEVPEFGIYAESLGLVWGARWRSPYEPWHFNMKNWKELADVRDEYRQYNHLA